jgi:hypothetical protein
LSISGVARSSSVCVLGVLGEEKVKVEFDSPGSTPPPVVERGFRSPGGSEPLRNQRKALSFRSIAQLLVPAGKLQFFAGGEGKGSCEVDGVIGAKRMSACALDGFREKRIVDGMAVDPSPEALQVLDCTAELSRGQSPSLAHPAQGCGRLDMRDRGGSDAVGLLKGILRLLRSRLIDQQLDQGAGIEIEVQRRPSET